MTTRRPSTEATIRRLPELSTAHLPKRPGIPGGPDAFAGVSAHAMGGGVLLWARVR